MRTTLRHRLQVLCMLLVMAAAMAVQLPGAPKADAALHNLFPADVNGFPKGNFRADDAMFITLTSDFYGGAVCVVDATVTNPASANCVNPPWGSANQYVALGTLTGVPFEGPLLRPGTWKLLATDTSGKNGNELSEPFTVVTCSPTCDPTAAEAQLQPWKDLATSRVPTAASEERALAIDIATRTNKIMKAAYTGLTFGLGAAVLFGGFAALNFDFVVPSTEDIAKSLHKQLSKTVREMYKGIADDPPDPNFATVAPPVFETIDVTGDTQVDAYFDAMMRAAAYGTASRVANERYQGAVIADDHAAAAMQAEASADFTYELIGQLRIVKSLEPTVAGRSWATEPVVVTPNGEDPTTWWNAQVAGMAALTPADLSASDRQFLKDHNPTITDAQIDAAVAKWSDPAFVTEMQNLDPTSTPADAMNATAATIPDTITALDKFGRWMSLNAADEQALAPASHPPVANPVDVTVNHDQATPVTLSGSDPDGDPITYAVATSPSHGALSGTAPNLTYTPDAGYAGSDSFTYTVSDGSLTSAPATVSIDVLANRAPVAAPVNVNVFQDEASPVTLSGSDPDGDPITYAVATSPSHGALSGTAPNLTYTPDAGYAGSDSFTYTVTDGTFTSAPGTVRLTVRENRPPVATARTYSVVPGLPTSVPLGGSDPDARPITFAVATSPSHGALSGTAPNLTYTPDGSFDTGDSFDFTVSDGVHTTSATISFIPARAIANDDAFDVSGAQISDVTWNDSPTGAAVTGVTDPAHGTVSCSQFGMCLYVADEGYTGPDSFDYTVVVGANTDTATVSVTVGAPPATATGVPTANNDTLTTPMGTPGTVDVLANDSGDGTLVATPSDGEHGTVACEVDGTCTYTPTDASFTGFDQFTYTLSNGTDVDTGLVRVRVGATSAGLEVTGPPTGTDVQPGGALDWLFDLVGIGPVETGLSRTDPVVATLAGRQGTTASDIETAAGWSATVAGDTVTATPGQGALLGNEATSVLPRPLPPISQGTGGDGHVPILVGSKVFAFFHHKSPTQVTCLDRATGQLCPGYPKTVPLGTRNTPGPGAVIGNQIWVHLYDGGYQVSGMFCWDASTNATCGFVASQRGGDSWEGTAPMLIEGKLWFATATGRLRCVDPTTGTVCTSGPYDTGVTFRYDYGDIVNIGTRVYVSNHNNVACTDVATGADCAGWPEDGRELPGNLVRSHDGTTGAVNGVCGVQAKMNCVLDDDPSQITTTDVRWNTELTYSATVEAEAGTRTFWGRNGTAGLGCFDWSTMELCDGPAFNGYGFSSYDIGKRPLPSAYGAVWDGSCAVGLGDPGKLFTMDFEGNSPCTSLDSGSAPLKIDLRLQRFDHEVGDAAWDQVRVFGTDLTAGTNFTSFLLTVRDGESGEKLIEQEMVDTDGILDLSGIDPTAHPSLTIGATSRSVDGGDAWADGNAPKVQLTWKADQAPLHIGSRAAEGCPALGETSLTMAGASGELSATAAATLGIPAACVVPPTTTTPPTTMPPVTTPPVTTAPGTPTAPDPTTPAESANPSDPVVPAEPGAVAPIAQEGTADSESVESSAELPATGSSLPATAPFAALAMLVGAMLIVFARRKARHLAR